MRCGSMQTKRNGYRKLKSRQRIHRFLCLDCNHSWTFTSAEKINAKTEKQIIRESMERASVRILARRFCKSKTTVISGIHAVCKHLADSVTLAGKLKPGWSGVLVVDGKWIRAYDPASQRIIKKLSKEERKRLHRFVWLLGVDSGTGDIPNHSIAEEETKIDIMMYFQDLKRMDYPLKAVISDGVPWYGQAAKKIFGKQVIVQHCTRHFLERCRERMRENELGLKSERTAMLIYFIKHIIEASRIGEAKAWLKRLKRNKRVLIRTQTQKWILRRFKQEAKYLTAHLLHQGLNIPHTNNDVENMIGQAEKRLSTICRFNHWQNARDYLNAWTLWRRFAPFTDCRGKRKNRNGKSPLELAGVDTNGINWTEL